MNTARDINLEKIRNSIEAYKKISPYVSILPYVFKDHAGNPSLTHMDRNYKLKYDTFFFNIFNNVTGKTYWVKAEDMNINTLSHLYTGMRGMFTYNGKYRIPRKTRERLARIWRHLHERTSCHFSSDAKDYFLVGIDTEYTINNYGYDAFTKFVDDLYDSYLKASEKFPGKALSLDRIRGEFGYFKENLRWVPMELQYENKLSNRTVLVITANREIIVADSYDKYIDMTGENKHAIKEAIIRGIDTPMGAQISLVNNLFRFKYENINDNEATFMFE